MVERILFLEEYSEKPTGGINDIRTYYRLASKNYETEFLWIDAKNKQRDSETRLSLNTKKYEKYLPLELKRTGMFLEPSINPSIISFIKEYSPEVIITSRQLTRIANNLTDTLDAKTISLVNAYELLYTKDYFHNGNNILSKIINTSLYNLNSRLAKQTLAETDLNIANSKYTKKTYKKHTGIDMKVSYPPIDKEDYKVESRGEKILHVNPVERKGIETTLKVAKKMQDEEFIILGKPESQKVNKKIKDLDNVEPLEYIEDIKNAYKQTKLVLMPSRWNEPYGRIPVEAGISGIPTIHSGKGGLNESGLQKLSVKQQKPEKYIDKINMVKNDYEKFSKLTIKNVEDNGLNSFKNKFENLIHQI